MAVDPVFLSTAVEAALEAGHIHRRFFRKPLELDIHKKGRIDLVTAADLEVEQMFRDLVARRFRNHGVIGEESGSSASNRPGASCQWIIDPVDGTTNFAHGLAFFCVSIALQVDGRLEVGVVYDPIAEELFTAERGQGARLNGTRLAVSSCPSLVDAMLVTGFPYTVREERLKLVRAFTGFLEEAQAVRRLGSAALDLCCVAAGRMDGYWEDGIHPWDVAAGALIVAEAGGTVTDLDGRPLDLFNGRVLASNGLLHPEMIRVLEASRAPATH